MSEMFEGTGWKYWRTWNQRMTLAQPGGSEGGNSLKKIPCNRWEISTLCCAFNLLTIHCPGI